MKSLLWIGCEGHSAREISTECVRGPPVGLYAFPTMTRRIPLLPAGSGGGAGAGRVRQQHPSERGAGTGSVDDRAPRADQDHHDRPGPPTTVAAKPVARLPAYASLVAVAIGPQVTVYDRPVHSAAKRSFPNPWSGRPEPSGRGRGTGLPRRGSAAERLGAGVVAGATQRQFGLGARHQRRDPTAVTYSVKVELPPPVRSRCSIEARSRTPWRGGDREAFDAHPDRSVLRALS